MSLSQEQHSSDHDALVRLLVEGELKGQEKQAAETRLLSCLDCLEEYNAYRRFWRTVTGNEYRKAQEEHLRQTNVGVYRKYRELMEKLATASSKPSSPFDGVKRLVRARLFYQPAFSAALMLLLVLALPYFVYESVRLERETASLLETNRRYQRLLENQAPPEKIKEEARAQYENQITALNEKIADLSKPGIATPYSIAPGRQRGVDETYPPVKFAKGAVALNLMIRVPSVYPAYAIEISDAGHGTSWQESGMKAEDESLSLTIPRAFFKKDKYTVTLYGVTARGDRKSLSQFPLRITEQK